MNLRNTVAAPAATVEVRGLTVRAGGRLLLDRADARFEPGAITLIVGPSGAGKSTLLRLLAGLHDPGAETGLDVSGSVQVAGQEVLGSRPGTLPVGVVFQQFALFDELSPRGNVQFAQAHRLPSRRSGDLPRADELLDELGVPRGVATGNLSGGQQQRLAIARTLAFDPEVILYDEPTSGLDVLTAAQFAGRIKTTQQTHPRTSIIVTHDLLSFAGVADHVYLLDARRKALREIDRAEWEHADRDRLAGLLGDARPPAEDTAEEAPARGFTARARQLAKAVGGRARTFLAETSLVLEAVLRLPLRLVPLWRSPRWGFRMALHYLRLVGGPLAWIYMMIAGVVAGFVATYFTFRFMPMRGLTEPLVREDVLRALGFALYRILIPVLATILIAARSGAAVTSDVGGKVYGQQIDALRTFGAPPERYLLTNILYAFLLTTPLLVVVSFLVSRWTSLCVFTTTHPDLGPFYWDQHFHGELRRPDSWLYRGTGWLMAKLLACAGGIGFIAYLVGRRPKPAARDISAGITRTILYATVYVLIVHVVFALYEF